MLKEPVLLASLLLALSEQTRAKFVYPSIQLVHPPVERLYINVQTCVIAALYKESEKIRSDAKQVTFDWAFLNRQSLGDMRGPPS